MANFFKPGFVILHWCWFSSLVSLPGFLVLSEPFDAVCFSFLNNQILSLHGASCEAVPFFSVCLHRTDKTGVKRGFFQW